MLTSKKWTLLFATSANRSGRFVQLVLLSRQCWILEISQTKSSKSESEKDMWLDGSDNNDNADDGDADDEVLLQL